MRPLDWSLNVQKMYSNDKYLLEIPELWNFSLANLTLWKPQRKFLRIPSHKISHQP